MSNLDRAFFQLVRSAGRQANGRAWLAYQEAQDEAQALYEADNRERPETEEEEEE